MERRQLLDLPWAKSQRIVLWVVGILIVITTCIIGLTTDYPLKEGVLHLVNQFDSSFFIMLLAGFLAQLVDGALGMGYGVTSATILLSAGVSPAAISGSIHTAEMFASAASGFSHYKFGNVNKKLFKVLVIPGIIGAVAGALMLVFLGNQYGNYIRPVIAIYTLILGI